MKKTAAGHRYALVLLGAIGAQQTSAAMLSHPLLDVVDINPKPRVFAAALRLDEQEINIGGTAVHVLIYKDANNPAAYTGMLTALPLPQIVVGVGDEVIVTLTNDLAPCAACDTSIHWHGLELDNDSDGTGVTQNRLAPGESYTYRFLAPRPGVFWFHPHMKPGPQAFAGAYGAFIVKDPREQELIDAGKIPSSDSTHTIVLSDIEFDVGGDVGYLDENLNAVPWMVLKNDCAAGDGRSCRRIKDAATVLVNGQATSSEIPAIVARSGAGVRLRLINAATHRYFRLRISGNGADNNLYRIGGEGGLLEFARLEGGVSGNWDTLYNKGEIVIGPSARADVVIVPAGLDGGLISIAGDGYQRGGPSDNNPAGDLLHIVIDNTLSGGPLAIAEGSEILGAGGVENLKDVPITDSFIAPVPILPNPGAGAGSAGETISLQGIAVGQLAIDLVTGRFEDSGPDYTQVPFQDSTRYAATGDTLEVTVTQKTAQHHPFHLHGFSFQPVRILDSSDNVLYEFDYNEFVDVIDIFDGQSAVIRVRLDDRPRITDNRQEAEAPVPGQRFASGGARGRWLFHCHLFLHAALGMISELVVVDTDRDGDGFDTAADCDDFDPGINPAARELGDGVDNDCNGRVDDASPRLRFDHDLPQPRSCVDRRHGECFHVQ